jgi:sucrose-6F-phosphate phosphohydrolase
MKSFLIATDLDNTLVGDKTALSKLNAELESHRQKYKTKIVYATGRSLTLYRELSIAEKMIRPDALITSVGTEIYLDADNATLDQEWHSHLAHNWNRDKIAELVTKFENVIPQSDSEQRPFKISYHLDKANSSKVLPQLHFILQTNKLKANIIYSSDKDLDILPLQADKGVAVHFLQKKWNIDTSRSAVSGDSGNDISLFKVPDIRGIIVSNAQQELLSWYNQNKNNRLYLSKKPYSYGILEGLYHFEFLK